MNSLLSASPAAASLKPPLPKMDLELMRRPSLLGPPKRVQEQLSKFKEKYNKSTT